MSSIRRRIHALQAAFRQNLARFTKNEEGVTMLEYTILIGIITVAVILAVVYAGSWVTVKWNALTTALT